MFKIGDVVWAYDTWGNLTSGKITNIITDANTTWYELRGCNETIGSYGAKADDCYATKNECIKAAQETDAKRCAEYKASIKDVKDLVAFAYNNNISWSEEYTNLVARKAYCERAKELLGLQLDN